MKTPITQQPRKVYANVGITKLKTLKERCVYGGQLMSGLYVHVSPGIVWCTRMRGRGTQEGRKRDQGRRFVASCAASWGPLPLLDDRERVERHPPPPPPGLTTTTDPPR